MRHTGLGGEASIRGSRQRSALVRAHLRDRTASAAIRRPPTAIWGAGHGRSADHAPNGPHPAPGAPARPPCRHWTTWPACSSPRSGRSTRPARTCWSSVPIRDQTATTGAPATAQPDQPTRAALPATGMVALVALTGCGGSSGDTPTVTPSPGRVKVAPGECSVISTREVQTLFGATLTGPEVRVDEAFASCTRKERSGRAAAWMDVVNRDTPGRVAPERRGPRHRPQSHPHATLWATRSPPPELIRERPTGRVRGDVIACRWWRRACGPASGRPFVVSAPSRGRPPVGGAARASRPAPWRARGPRPFRDRDTMNAYAHVLPTLLGGRRERYGPHVRRPGGGRSWRLRRALLSVLLSTGPDTAKGPPPETGNGPLTCKNSGGAEGTRTPDPHTASVVRYQLRHSPAARFPGPVLRVSSIQVLADGPRAPPTQLKTTVLFPCTSTRSSRWNRSPRASTVFSMSLPYRT
jgi:hypothetical protein